MRVPDEQVRHDIEMERSEVNFMQSMYMVDSLKDYAADLLEARELIKEMREELREVLVSREHGEAKEMVFITNFAEIESILERTKEYVE